MKTAILATTALLLATPAFALNDDIVSNNVNSGSFVGIGGNANNAVINNGAGSGTTSLAGGSVTNSGNSSATGGTVSNSGNSSSVANGGVGIGGVGVGGSQSQSASTGNQSVNVEARKRNPVATAYSAPLVAAPDTCLGSSSAGLQAVGFGISGGSTVEGDACVRWVDSRKLAEMGHASASLARFCMDDKVRQAMLIGGTPCPQDEESYQGENSISRASEADYPSQNRPDGRPR